MGKARRVRVYRTPTEKEQSKILFTGYRLVELFDDQQIEDFMAAARRRVIGEFVYATEPNPRYKFGSDRRSYQRTDNYIWGVSDKIGDMATYVNKHMHRPFISERDLPADLTELNPKMIDMVLQRARHDVLAAVIQVMRDDQHEIWYDEARGVWQVCQSSVDEFLAYKRAAKAMRVNPDKTTARSNHRVKADMRPFHGRVRSQSKSRGIPPGTSIGIA